MVFFVIAYYSRNESFYLNYALISFFYYFFFKFQKWRDIAEMKHSDFSWC